MSKTAYLSEIYSYYSSRNVVEDIKSFVICPILEEVLYRGAILTFVLSRTNSINPAIWFTSLSFGACHIHRIFGLLSRGYSASQAILSVFFMFTYTTLFGVMSSYVYVRSGSIMASILVHALCNFFSFPTVSYRSEKSSLYPYRKKISVAYLFGILQYIICYRLFLNPSFLKSPFYS